jgi:hypothetical protein
MIDALWTFIQNLIFAFTKAILSYEYSPNVYSEFSFTETCAADFFTGTSFVPGMTLPSRCKIPSEFTTPSTNTADKINWKVSANGFHTAFNLSYRIAPSINLSHCLSILYIPSTSFLDVGDAQDRELPAHQRPKFHYFAPTTTFFEVQPRYQPLNGSGRIVIHPPPLL